MKRKQVTYNSSFSGETQVTLDIQQYMNNKAMYIGLCVMKMDTMSRLVM